MKVTYGPIREKDGYPNTHDDLIVFVKREGINCANISEEDFIDYMMEDLREADLIHYDELKTRFDEKHQVLPNYLYNRYEQEANKRWKTAAKRDAFMDARLKEWQNAPFHYNHLYFDMDLNPTSVGISDNCILRTENLIRAKLAKCFDEIKDNKYFTKANGWRLVSACDKNEYNLKWRPFVELIIPEDTKQQMRDEEENLRQSVNRFYDGCKYFGD